MRLLTKLKNSFKPAGYYRFEQPLNLNRSIESGQEALDFIYSDEITFKEKLKKWCGKLSEKFKWSKTAAPVTKSSSASKPQIEKTRNRNVELVFSGFDLNFLIADISDELNENTADTLSIQTDCTELSFDLEE